MALKVTALTRSHIPVMRLKGELDVSQGGKLQSRVRHLVTEGHKGVVLNMVQLDYLDSSGLGSLVAIAKLFRSTGGHLVLITNEFVDEILAITRLNELFETAESEKAALELLENARQPESHRREHS